jgi:predicted N-acetyltransferase YhbS
VSCNEGGAKLEKADCPFMIVLGDPGYYSRFGFASDRGALDILFLAYTL